MIHGLRTMAFTLCMALVSPPALGQDSQGLQARHIVVDGTGTVAATPDILRVTVAVQAEATEAADAIREMSAQLEAVLLALTSAGIAAADMQTTNLNLSPRYVSPRDTPAAPTLVGFFASSDLTIVVRDLDQSGEILDSIVAAGVSQINNLQLDIEARGALLEEARIAAISDAIAKTTRYAEAADVTAGAILSISEVQSGAGPQPFESLASRSVPIAQGRTTITAQVRVVTAIE